METFKYTYLPDQLVSDSEKQNESFWKPTMDYWIGRAKALNDKTQVAQNINFANGIIDPATYEYALRPLAPQGIREDIMKKLPGELRDTDVIGYVREKYQGEYIQLPYKFFAKTNNPDAKMQFDAKLKAQIQKVIQMKFIALMNANEQDTNFETSKDANVDIDTFVKEESQKYFDERAKKAQDTVELINDETDFDTIRNQAFFYWFATESFYDWRTINDKGHFEKHLISPIEGYPIFNGEQFVEDMDGFLYERKLSWTQFVAKYKNKLTREELMYMETLSNNSTTSGQVTMIAPGDVIYDRIITSYGSTYSDQYGRVSDTIAITDKNNITEHIIQFIVPREVNILKYVDPLDGQEHDIEVAKDYTFSPESGDISISSEVIMETWTGVRLGDQHSGIYIKPERDICQRRSVDGKLKLHFGGKSGLLKHININPIPKRLSIYQALDRIILLNQERAMAKMKDAITTIPKSVLADNEQELVDQYFYMIADGVLIYDDANITADSISKAFRIVGHPAADKYLVTLVNLRKENRQEALDVANMNSERAGGADSQGGKAIMEQNIFRAKISSILMIHMFHKALERSHQADLDVSQYAWVNGKKGSYLNKKTNSVVDVEIDGFDHLGERYSIFVVDTKAEEDIVSMYKQMAFSAGQNAEFKLASEAINIDNAAEGREIIEKLDKAKKEWEAYLAGIKGKSAQDLQTSKNQNDELNRQKDITLEQMRQDGENYRAQLTLNNNVLSSATSTEAEKTAAKERLVHLQSMYKGIETDKKLQDNEKNRQVKREEIANNYKIAKANKN